jgi:hypothetical protein
LRLLLRGWTCRGLAQDDAGDFKKRVEESQVKLKGSKPAQDRQRISGANRLDLFEFRKVFFDFFPFMLFQAISR